MTAMRLPSDCLKRQPGKTWIQMATSNGIRGSEITPRHAFPITPSELEGITGLNMLMLQSVLVTSSGTSQIDVSITARKQENHLIYN